MSKVIKKLSILFAIVLSGTISVQAQKSPQDMNRFIDALMKKMTVDEKIGQLNLPVTGDITTGQAKSSDIAGKIKRGEVGGLFNLKGVENPRRTETCRREFPTRYSSVIRHGCHSWIRNNLPHPTGLIMYVGYEGHRRIGPYRCCRSKCRRYLMDFQPYGGHQP